MVDQLAQFSNRASHTPIAIAPFMMGENGLNLPLQHFVFVASLRGLQLVIEGAAGQASQLKQTCQGKVVP